SPEMSDSLFDEMGGNRGILQIAGNIGCVRAQFGGESRQGGVLFVVQHHARTLGDESARHSFADSTSRSGHQGNFIAKTHPARRNHGFSTPFTISPACMASKASRHSV